MKNAKQLEDLLLKSTDPQERDFLKKAIRLLRLTCDGKFISINLEKLKSRLADYEQQGENIWCSSTGSIKEKKEQQILLNRLYEPQTLRRNIKVLKFVLE